MAKLALVDNNSSWDRGFPAAEAPMARLARVVIGLDAVMQRQRREIARFREVIDEMDRSVNELRKSLCDYDQALERIDVKRLRRKSMRLLEIVTPHAP